MSDKIDRRYVESLGVDDLPNEKDIVEATLYNDGTFNIYTEDADGTVSIENLTVGQLQAIHQMIGHLLYVESRGMY